VPQPDPLYDLLAIGAHPDDAELFAGGTLAVIAAAGYKTAVLDLTRGEAATSGSPERRAQEADEAGKILGVSHREQLDLGDGRIADHNESRIPVVNALRRLRPSLVITHGPDDRHPDHVIAHQLVREAVFFANVAGFAAVGDRWKIEGLAFFYGNTFQPDPRADWVVDISQTITRKYQALEAYASQFRTGQENRAGATYIGSHAFWEQLERRSRMWGHFIGVEHGEPFLFMTPAHAAHPLVRLSAPKQKIE
jgi:N-acetylglucosamine malate deacetylase 1